VEYFIGRMPFLTELYLSGSNPEIFSSKIFPARQVKHTLLAM